MYCGTHKYAIVSSHSVGCSFVVKWPKHGMHLSGSVTLHTVSLCCACVSNTTAQLTSAILVV